MDDRFDDMYDDHILDHFESPYHRGPLACASCTHADKNPICGDQLELQLRLEEGCVAEAWFTGRGCAISQAAASILCQYVEGKTLDELKTFQAKQMLDLIGVRLTASRQKCGLLSFKIFKTMLYSLDASGANPPAATASETP